MGETLVLNARFEPLSTVSLRRAVALVLAEKAVVERARPGLRVRAAHVDLPLPGDEVAQVRAVPFRQRASWARRGVLVRDRRR